MGSGVATLKAALTGAEDRALGTPVAGFIEAHIEQGPIVEETGNVIGVVTGMQGNRRFFVDVVGEDAHSGTTPLSRRKDAFVAATDMARALWDLFHGQVDGLRLTTGRFGAAPGPARSEETTS